MGRKKIRIERIGDDRNRSVTFNKRKVGLMKKAIELSVLCDCDVAVLVFHDHQLYQFSSHDFIDQTINRYFAYEGPYECIRTTDLDDLKPGKASSFKVGTTLMKQRRAPVPQQISDEIFKARLVSSPPRNLESDSASGVEAKVLSVAPVVVTAGQSPQPHTSVKSDKTDHCENSSGTDFVKVETKVSAESSKRVSSASSSGSSTKRSKTVASENSSRRANANFGASNCRGASVTSSPPPPSTDNFCQKSSFRSTNDAQKDQNLLVKRGRGQPLSIDIPISSSGVTLTHIEPTMTSANLSAAGNMTVAANGNTQQHFSRQFPMIPPPMWQNQHMAEGIFSPPLQIAPKLFQFSQNPQQQQQQQQHSHDHHISSGTNSSSNNNLMSAQGQYQLMADSKQRANYPSAIYLPQLSGMEGRGNNPGMQWAPNAAGIMPMLSPPFPISNLPSPSFPMQGAPPLHPSNTLASSLSSPFGIMANGSPATFAATLNASSSAR